MRSLQGILNKLSAAMIGGGGEDIPEPKPDALTGCRGEPIGASWPFISKKTPDMPIGAGKCEVIRAYYKKLKTHFDQCRSECFKSKTGGFDDAQFVECLKKKHAAYVGSGGATSVNVYMTPEPSAQQVKPDKNIPTSNVDPERVRQCEKSKLRCQCEYLGRKYESLLNSAREAELFINKCSPEYRTPNEGDENRPSMHEQFRRRCMPIRARFPVENKCDNMGGRWTYGDDCGYICSHCGVTK